MTRENEKEKRTACARLIEDFAKAEDINETMNGLIKNVQKLFNFSPHFVDTQAARLTIPENTEIEKYVKRSAGGSFTQYSLDERFQIFQNSDLLKNPRLSPYVSLELIRNDLNHIFSDIMKKQMLSENESFSIFVDEYYNYLAPVIVLDDDTFVIPDEPTFSEAFFDGRVRPYEYVITYALISFLADPDNRELIYQCESCRSFYISKKNDERNIRCSKCPSKSNMSKEDRRIYQREYRARKAKEKEDIRRKTEVASFLEKLDISEEEAVKLREDDNKP